MARRTVMKESTKCRSGRAAERCVAIRPSFRGGKVPRTLTDDERVAAEDDRDVVIPSGEGAAFEVIEPELSLEVFVGALGSPALLHQAHDPLLAHASRQRGEHEVRRSLLALGPLDHEPERFTIVSLGPIVLRDFHAAEAEAG